MGIFSFSNNSDEFKIGDMVRIKYRGQEVYFSIYFRNFGDMVRIKYRGQEGYIIDKNGNLYMVSINNGQVVDSYSANDLEKCW